ncbi:MAG: site-specific DNA-methyltransferase [Actinomycetia bacterium]|nr:site-specific DNA-methyltransferase [Actinomycetes bacterium]
MEGVTGYEYELATLYHADCIEWLDAQPEKSIHGVVTDPPYGIVEYNETQQTKLRSGTGGVWRIPPSYDGHKRSPIPRFTTLTKKDLADLQKFFAEWGRAVHRVLVPGAHIMVASNPLVSYLVAMSLVEAGFERRGEITRLVQTMRGGDRPKGAHDEFDDVSVMMRSQMEPWLVCRKPFEGTVADNLRKYGTGGLRRISAKQPFGDVIRSAPTGVHERALADHPSLKPQNFLRQIVRAVLPLGEGIVLDPFAGSGSTLAAANFVGYQSIGVEADLRYIRVAVDAVPRLTEYKNGAPPVWTS